MIKELHLQNYKCFVDNKINLGKITLLVGANAVGKSSLIQALLLIRQTIDRLRDTIVVPDRSKILLNGEYCLNLGNSSQVLYANAHNEEIKFKLKNDNMEKYFNYRASRTKKELYLEVEGHNCETIGTEKLSIFHNEIHYLNTERIGPRAIQDMRNHRFPNTGYRGEYTGHVIADNKIKVDELRRIKDENKSVPNLNKQVEYWLDYIIPGVELDTQIFRDINIVGMSLKRKYSGTDFLNPNNMGFGISYVLPIIVSGLIAKEGCMFIVENPEAHLHPSGQSRIGQFLAQIASAGVQVLVETHSEHVINGIRTSVLKGIISNQDISINFLNIGNEESNVAVEHIKLNEFADISHWPKGFLDQEEQDLRELIRLRKGVKR
jgi:predicted ATPase